MLAAFFTLVAFSAEAGTTTVVYGSGDPTSALARVQAVNPKAGELVASTLSNLLQGAEASVSGAQLHPCVGNPTTLEALSSLQSQIEGMVGYMEFETALTTIDQATSSLACVRDRVDESIAARLFFLEGIAAHGTEDTERAKAAFSTALVFDPELVWDDYFAPDAKPLLDLASTDLKKDVQVELNLVPAPAAGSLWIDGRLSSEPTLELPPGDHLVQVVAGRLRTFRLTLVAGSPATLIIPEAMGDERADWIAEEKIQSDLNRVFEIHLEPGRTLYFSTPDGVWQTETGTGNWESVETTHQQVTSSDLPTADSQPGILARGLTLSGSTIAGAGVLLTGVSAMIARNAKTKAESVCNPIPEPCTMSNWDDFSGHFNNFQASQRTLKVGYAIGATGAVIASAGWVLTDHSPFSLQPWIDSQGAGLVLTR